MRPTSPKTVFEGFKIFLLGALILLLMPAPLLAAGEEVFSIRGIEVDIAARTAIRARDRAITTAEKRAFAALLEKLLDHDEAITLENFSPLKVREYVQAFEVEDEKSASGRYIATYNIRFDADRVRALFGRRKIAYSEIPGPKLLLLPVVERHGAKLLWQQENPWWQVLSSDRRDNFLHQFVTPEGNFEERLTWSPGKLERKLDLERLAEFMDPYGADDVLLLSARIVQPRAEARGMVLFSYRRLLTPSERGWGRVYFAQADEEADVLERVFLAVAGRLDQNWKGVTRTLFGAFNSIIAEVETEDIDAWVDLRKRLRRAAMVQSVVIEEIALPVSRLRINYLGSPEQLRLTLEQVGLRLQQQNGKWQLVDPARKRERLAAGQPQSAERRLEQ